VRFSRWLPICASALSRSQLEAERSLDKDDVGADGFGTTTDRGVLPERDTSRSRVVLGEAVPERFLRFEVG